MLIQELQRMIGEIRGICGRFHCINWWSFLMRVQMQGDVYTTVPYIAGSRKIRSPMFAVFCQHMQKS